MLQPPADPAHPARHGFSTIPLFASDQLDTQAALQRALKAFLALCEERQLPPPAVAHCAPAAFPCWLVVTLRQHVTTQQQIGHLLLQQADGRSWFDIHWPVGQAVPVPPEPAIVLPPAPNRQVKVSLLPKRRPGAPRFTVSALHPEPGRGGEITFGADRDKTGFTEPRLRAFLAATYGMADAAISHAVQAAKAAGARPLAGR